MLNLVDFGKNRLVQFAFLVWFDYIYIYFFFEKKKNQSKKLPKVTKPKT